MSDLKTITEAVGLLLRVPSCGTAKPGVCIVKQIQKVHIVKGLLVFVLAPPAGYIPRHCRGTPFKRGRCRRAICIHTVHPIRVFRVFRCSIM